MDKISSPQGHYLRLRQHFLSAGIDGFLDYEVVELLLKLADNRRDQKITAKLLLNTFKSLRGVLEANPEQLKKIKGIGELFKGTLTTSAVYPREVIKLILEKDAAAVIFVHNHPSGNPNPSKDDQNLTQKLKATCSTIDVQLHDHLIIAGNDYTSMADKGMV